MLSPQVTGLKKLRQELLRSTWQQAQMRRRLEVVNAELAKKLGLPEDPPDDPPWPQTPRGGQEEQAPWRATPCKRLVELCDGPDS